MPPAKKAEVTLYEEDEGQEFVEVKLTKLGNEKFLVHKSTNMFNLLGVFDEESPANLPRYLINVTAARDRVRLKTALAQQGELTIDDLFLIFGEITEAQADGRPTVSLSASPNGSPKRAASTRSAGT
jgi:hypothetical protein